MSQQKLTAAIDQLSLQFASDVEAVQERLVKLVSKLLKNGVSREAIIEQLAEPDVVRRLREELGFNRASDQIINGYRDTVLATLRGSGLSEAQLGALTRISQRQFTQEMGRHFAGAVDLMTQQLLTGADPNAIRAALKGALRPDQVEALANTTLNTYSATVRAAVAEKEPASTRYVYEGPIDGKTRDICLKMAAAGALTKAEIDRQFPGAFVIRGGYNCRHAWVRVDEAVDVNTKAAEERVNA